MYVDTRCGHFLGAEGRHCHAAETRRFLVGYRCMQHTPSAVKGRDDSWWINAPGGGARR